MLAFFLQQNTMKFFEYFKQINTCERERLEGNNFVDTLFSSLVSAKDKLSTTFKNITFRITALPNIIFDGKLPLQDFYVKQAVYFMHKLAIIFESIYKWKSASLLLRHLFNC